MGIVQYTLSRKYWIPQFHRDCKNLTVSQFNSISFTGLNFIPTTAAKFSRWWIRCVRFGFCVSICCDCGVVFSVFKSFQWILLFSKAYPFWRQMKCTQFYKWLKACLFILKTLNKHNDFLWMKKGIRAMTSISISTRVGRKTKRFHFNRITLSLAGVLWPLISDESVSNFVCSTKISVCTLSWP